MGLGKTFQVVSFVELFLRCTSARRVLCILPINTLQNWLSEFNQWLPVDGQQRLDSETVMSYKRPFRLYVINDLCKTSKQRVDTILGWKRTGGVLLIGYEMFRILVSASAAAADAAAGGGSHFISRPNKKKSIPVYIYFFSQNIRQFKRQETIKYLLVLKTINTFVSKCQIFIYRSALYRRPWSNMRNTYKTMVL